MASPLPNLLSVQDAGRRLGVSVSTVWRLIRRGALQSVRQGGRRWIPDDALGRQLRRRAVDRVPPLTRAHPIFRMVGTGRSGGQAPGARDKHGVLDP